VSSLKIVNAQKDNLSNVSLIIKVHPDLANAVHHRQVPNTKLKELLDVEKELGIVLKPIHPGAKDRSLSPYFSVNLSDRATAEKMISRLQKCKAVEAAYFKPPAELAGSNNALGELP
jgi:hypothetical protein